MLEDVAAEDGSSCEPTTVISSDRPILIFGGSGMARRATSLFRLVRRRATPGGGRLCV